MSDGDGLRESALERGTREESRNLRVRCWVVIFISLAGSVIFAAALTLTSKVEAERRIFMATILGVTQLCCIMMLVVARNSVETLNVFILVCAYVAGLMMGPVWCI
jgi:uncharacterized membrane protein